jgi:S-DNA-T family DNA segregation ATPase FtsK/SpoIIIE
VELVHDDGPAARDLTVHIGHPDARVGDLAAALGAPGGRLYVDGRAVRPELPLAHSGIVTGATVRTTGPGVGAPPRTAGGGHPAGAPAPALLRVVGGLMAGATIPLPVGATVLGRQGDVVVDDVGVSRTHCRLDVDAAGAVQLTDLDSRNGTEVNGERVAGTRALGAGDLIGLGGAVLLRVDAADEPEPVIPADPVREARGGAVALTRPPRARTVPDGTSHPLPVPPGGRTGPTFSISMLLGPLAMAVAFVAISGDVRYGAIAALTPVMYLANLVEERTRGRRSMRRSVRDYRARVDELDGALRRHRDGEVRRRRAAYPDPARLLDRPAGPSARLWERRPDAGDFLDVCVGTADLAWQPPVRSDPGGPPPPEVAEILRATAILRQVPVPVSLSAGHAVGVRGHRRAALAVARWLLCQAAVTSGPADVTVAVFTDPDRCRDWDWAKWLPHTLDRAGGGRRRLLAAGPAATDALARALLADGSGAAWPGGAAAPGPTHAAAGAAHGGVLLVVVDGAALLEGRPCPLRDLLGGAGPAAAGIVITPRLPALCTTTVEAAADGSGVVRRVSAGDVQPEVLLTGVTEAGARRCARALARFDDPEVRVAGAGLPATTTLLPLLGLSEVGGAAVAERWREGARELRARAVLGVTEHGVFSVDLDDDGPHGLIAGTTGSGKSELLRTLVASLAVGNDPDHLTFALVDYKGGGALDECARLPHSVGLVTDLDEQLGARALRCLQAELRHREHLLRAVGLSHVRDYQRLRDTRRPELPPMPRLVVVIDEFATLVRALPDFVDSLVGIAQLGRSLGIHLIMATQRPAGAVSEAIKNNVKLRIALRLESAADSQDVIDSPAAAAIGGRQWGRAFHRVSAVQVQPVQTALSSGVSVPDAARVSVAPFAFGAATSEMVPLDGGPTDLHRLVAAAGDAFARSGLAAPRAPWPPPLPPVVDADDAPPAGRGLQTDTTGVPALALADDPDRQTRYPVGWDPAAGNLLLYGAVGAGTTGALAAVALGWARRHSPTDLHIYLLDLGAGELAPLAALPHAGAHIGTAERERQVRLVRLLRTELDARKAAGARGRPDWLVVIDNLGALLAEHDRDAAGTVLVEDLSRVYADGPGVGIRFAVSADRSGAVPGAWAALTQQKLLLRLADPAEYGYFDIPRRGVPAFVPGRGVVATTGQVIQVVHHRDLAAAVRRTARGWPGAARSAAAVGVLPGRVALSAVPATARLSADPVWIPIGLDDDTLQPAGLQLYEHEHALIGGPARSGRSTALCTVAAAARAAAPDLPILGLAARRSPLPGYPVLDVGLTDPAALPAALGRHPAGPLLLLVDDADALDDPGGAVEALVRSRRPGVHVVAAGRTDALRRLYGHWTQALRDSRCGLLLMPDVDLDGDLFGVTLPRLRRLAPLPGRGYLAADGAVGAVQVALPDAAPSTDRQVPDMSSICATDGGGPGN